MINFKFMRATSSLVIVALGVSGCSWFLPPHPNSEDREGERVYIKMIESCDDLLVKSETAQADGSNRTAEDYYQAVFGMPCLDAELYSKQRMATIQRTSLVALGTLGAAAVVAAVGLTVDFAVDQLKKEAKRYEAQWQQRIAKGDFWTAVEVPKEKAEAKEIIVSQKCEGQPLQDADPECEVDLREFFEKREVTREWRQKYVGFAVCRVTKETIKRQPDDVTGNTESNPCSMTSASAAKIVFGIAPSPDEKFFLIAPLSFQITKSKAKVLSDRPWTFIPPIIVGKFIDYDGHSIDVDISIEMTAYSVNEKNQGVVTPIAAETFKISDYNIETGETLTSKNDGLQAQPMGWLWGPPATGTPKEHSEAGNFALRVLVTERDSTNAKTYLEAGATRLEEKKTVIQNFIGSQLSSEKKQ